MGLSAILGSLTCPTWTTQRSIFSGFRAIFLGHLLLALSSCLLAPPEDDFTGSRDTSPGQVYLRVSLEQNQRALAKTSAADTIFSLDTLIVVLSAAGEPTQTYRYSIAGRADTGKIALPALAYTLGPLRNWKARFYTIDTTASPVRRDTVHIDSVVFAVRPADTAVIVKTVSAAYSILRARFISLHVDSLGAGVQYVRLRVNGISRDSLALTGGVNNAVFFPTINTGWLAGDSGRVFKSIDSGNTWFVQSTGVSEKVNALWFNSATEGWAVGEGGRILKSNGSSWSQQASGITQPLKGVMFVSSSKGYAVGGDGTVLKTLNGGTGWDRMSGGWFSLESGTAADLYDVHFTSAATGYAVGASGVIRRTTNSGNSWTGMTSPTSEFFAGVHFGSSTAGYAVGTAGTIAKYNGSSWSLQASNSTNFLTGAFFTNATTGWVVGDSETILRTTNGGSTWINLPAGWVPQSSGISNTVNAVRFASATTGWAVADSGKILKTTNGGTSWFSQTNDKKKPLRGVHAISTSNVVAVGDSGIIKRSTNGSNWSTVTSGTTAELRSVHFASSSYGWAVGAGGTIRRSSNGGSNWSTQNSGVTNRLNAVSSNGNNRVLAVGDNGAVRRRNSISNTSNFSNASTTTIGTRQLNGVHMVSGSNTAYIVGNSGFIAKCTNSNNNNWSAQTSGTTENLLAVHFDDANTGWVAGENGTVLVTTNGGSNWTIQGSGGPVALRGVYALDGETAVVVGDVGAIYKTVNGGATWSGKLTRQFLYGVYFPSSTIGYVVGAAGAITKSTDAGVSWTGQTSGTSQTLYGTHFTSTSNGWAVGDGGTILRTTNGGTNWSAQSSGGSSLLYRVQFADANNGWVVGAGGKILRTTNAGVTWTSQTSETTANLVGLHIVNTDSVFAAGSAGTILKTRSGGILLTTTENLNAVYFKGETGYVVGDGGVALRTTDGGSSWSALTGGTEKLRSVFVSPSGNNVYAVGDAGQYLTTSNATLSSSWTVRSSGTSQTLHSVWVSTDRIYAVGDGGVMRSATALADLTQALSTGTTESLRSVQCEGITNNCWSIGSNEVVIRSTNVTSWVQKSSGAKLFEQKLAYKYLRPGISNTVLLQAIDRQSPLRGYQVSASVTVGAGQDSTITYGLTRCGYGGATPACTP